MNSSKPNLPVTAVLAATAVVLTGGAVAWHFAGGHRPGRSEALVAAPVPAVSGRLAGGGAAAGVRVSRSLDSVDRPESRETHAAAGTVARLAADWRGAKGVGERPRMEVELREAIRAWAARDARGAVSWVREQEPGLRAVAWLGIIDALSAQPELAVTLAPGLWRDESAVEAAAWSEALATGVARAGDLSSALTVAESAPGETRSEVLGTVFAVWCTAHPDDSPEIGRMLVDEQIAGRTRDEVLGVWAAAQPAQVVQLAQGLPLDHPARHAVWAAGLNAWVQQDPAAVNLWMQTLPAGPEREQALSTWLVRTDTLQRPTADALRQAEGLQDPGLRREVLDHVLLEWAAVDPISARAYAESTPLFASAQRQAMLAALTAPAPLP